MASSGEARKRVVERKGLYKGKMPRWVASDELEGGRSEQAGRRASRSGEAGETELEGSGEDPWVSESSMTTCRFVCSYRCEPLGERKRWESNPMLVVERKGGNHAARSSLNIRSTALQYTQSRKTRSTSCSWIPCTIESRTVSTWKREEEGEPA
jgi:hypothetical protein